MATVDKLTMLHMAVKDLDKEKKFYADQLGFKVTGDLTYDKDQAAKAGVPAGSRWISMELPGGGTTISLTNVYENMQPGSLKLQLSAPNIEATCDELKARGVKLAHEVTHAGWSTWFDFTDPEGNQWVVVESK